MKAKIKIGFTGTRKGMTPDQLIRFVETIGAIEKKSEIVEFHHGGCIGADNDAHILLKPMRTIAIVVHPPIDKTYTFNYFSGASKILPEKEYLDRNHDIVDACQILIACPKEKKEVKRSGTWATIRYARRIGKPVFVIEPE